MAASQIGRLCRRLVGWATDLRYAPEVVLTGVIVAVGIALALSVNTRVTGIILDETQIKQSAVHYTQGLPYNLFHDVYARATSRLYPLVISPLFVSLDGDVGVRIARALNVLLFASAALPAFLLARQVIGSRWRAAAAAALCVVVPWMTLTTALFTENLAYPLTLWCVYAMTLVLRRPAWWRDGLALLLIVAVGCTRTQLAALFLAYAAIVAYRLAWIERPRGRVEAVIAVRGALLRFPFSAAAVAAVIVVVVVAKAHGTLHGQLNHLLGTYSNTTSERKTLPSDVGISALVELLAISIGVGIAPAVMALAWYPRALSRRSPAPIHAFAVASVASIASVYALTIYSQGMYLDSITEERYYFYAAPLLLIAAFAAWDRAEIDRRRMVAAGAIIATIAATVPLPRSLDVESSFFAPAIVASRYLLDHGITRLDSLLGRSGISERDALAAIVLIATCGTAVAHRWAPRRGIPLALLAAAGAQIALLVVALVAIHGGIKGVPGRTGGVSFAELGFVDRASGGAPVTWLDNEVRDSEEQANFVQRSALFHNSFIRQRAVLPSLGITPDNYPLNGLPFTYLQANPLTGRLSVAPKPSDGVDYAVTTTDSPFFQIAGPVLGASPFYRLQIVRPAAPMRFRWMALGLSTEGGLAAGQSARLRAWDTREVILHLSAPSPASVSISLGANRRRLVVGQATDASVSLDRCASAAGRITVIAGSVRVLGVTLGPEPPPGAARLGRCTPR